MVKRQCGVGEKALRRQRGDCDEETERGRRQHDAETARRWRGGGAATAVVTFSADISSRDPSSWNDMLLYILLADRRLCSITARSNIVEPANESNGT